MKRRVQRLLVVSAGTVGMLGLLQPFAHAIGIMPNHCEPLS